MQSRKVLLLSLMFTVACGRQAGVPADARDVVTYRGNAARTGAMPGPGPEGTPSIKWEYAASGGIYSSPAVVNGTVYLLSEDGVVHALDLADGSARWRVSLGGDAAGSPLAVGDVLIVGDQNGTVHALDLDDGRVVWESPTDGAIGGSAAATGDIVVLATDHGTAYGLRPSTGEVAWQRGLGAAVARSIAIADGVAYVGASGGTLIGLDLADGSERLRTQVATAGEISTPAIANGTAYLAVGLDAEEPDARGIVAVATADGSPRWRYASSTHAQLYTPAVARGHAYLVGHDGNVVALDTGSGQVVWSVNAGSELEALPSIADGVLYTATNDGRALALDVATGHIVWSVPIEGIPWAPTVTGGYVLIGTSFGSLYAIGGSGS